MTKLIELGRGDKCRTASGRYLEHLGNLCFRDELGTDTYPTGPDRYDERCEIIDDWPHLSEGELFSLVRGDAARPNGSLVFRTQQDFRFRVRMNDYRITIPFRFESTDPRVGTALGKWTCRSGKIIRLMQNTALQISYTETPVLHILNGMLPINVPSQ